MFPLKLHCYEKIIIMVFESDSFFEKNFYKEKMLHFIVKISIHSWWKKLFSKLLKNDLNKGNKK